MEELHVMVTMDCERPTADTDGLSGKPRGRTQTGPPTYAESERFIRGYWETAQKYGCPVTFFIHPEVAGPHRDLFLDLQRQGACLGLHLHPWKFGDGRYPDHFGGFTPEVQRQILLESMAMWEESLGQRPLYFRPGTFSANDSTFRVLHELGFRGGSISLPGRIWNEFRCVWPAADPHPHRAHASFRGIAGDLAFAEVPLSVDFSSPVQMEGYSYYQDLRPDDDIDHRAIVWNILEQIAAQKPRHRSINWVTHNDHDFSDPNHLWRRRLEYMLESILSLGPRLKMKPVGATVASITDRVLDEG